MFKYPNSPRSNIAPGMRQMTSHLRAVDGRSVGANQAWTAAAARLRDPGTGSGFFCLAGWSTASWFLAESSLDAIEFVLAASAGGVGARERLLVAPLTTAIEFVLSASVPLCAGAIAPGKIVSTASFSETGSVKARMPERKPQARPTTKRKR